MVRPRQRTPANRIAIHVAITRKSAQLIQVFLGQHLAPVLRSRRIVERFRHPVIHAQIQIAQHKHRSLQPFRQIECRIAQFVALLHISRQQHNVLGIAV